MSTRGSIGFRHNSQDYLTYNHCDSYPEALGVCALEFTKEIVENIGVKWARKMLDGVKVIHASEESEPTPEDIEALKPYTDTSLGSKSTSDWYCLTRRLQGDLKEMLKCGYMLVNNDFIYDSAFCEYAYIINLDDEVLEVYKGFNQGRPGEESRYIFDQSKFAEHRMGPIEEMFFPCSIVAKFPFDNLPKDEGSFLRAITPMSEDESEWLEAQFDTYFEQSYANTLLAKISNKIEAVEMAHLVDELMNAFKSGYALEKYN